MDQKSGQENMAVEERWPLWGGGFWKRFECIIFWLIIKVAARLTLYGRHL